MPTRAIIDGETNEVSYEEYTAEESASREAEFLIYTEQVETARLAEIKKQKEKAALLTRLGISEAEAKLLLE